MLSFDIANLNDQTQTLEDVNAQELDQLAGARGRCGYDWRRGHSGRVRTKVVTVKGVPNRPVKGKIITPKAMGMSASATAMESSPSEPTTVTSSTESSVE